jgi:hypothetical protein
MGIEKLPLGVKLLCSGICFVGGVGWAMLAFEKEPEIKVIDLTETRSESA